MHEIAWNCYLFTQPDSAFYFAGLQYDFAKSVNNKNSMADALNTLGAVMTHKGDLIKANEYYNFFQKIFNFIKFV